MIEKFIPKPVTLKPLSQLLTSADIDKKTIKRAADAFKEDAPDPELKKLLEAD